MSELSIRPASRAELETMIGWAATEGWNPGHHDGDAFHATDPEGFLIGWLGDEPVAAVSAVAYDDGFGFLGFYICHPDHRGRGHGFNVWQSGIARLGDRTIGLDGVVDQQANYAKSGFVLAHRNIRYAGVVKSDPPADPRIVEVTDSDPALVAYDSRMFPVPRQAFLHRWIAAPGRRTLAWRESGTIRGYGTIRPCREGHKISLLFADTPEIAAALFAALTAPHRDTPVILDVRAEPGSAGARRTSRHASGVRDGPHVSRPRPRPAARTHLRHHHLRARMKTGEEHFRRRGLPKRAEPESRASGGAGSDARHQ